MIIMLTKTSLLICLLFLCFQSCGNSGNFAIQNNNLMTATPTAGPLQERTRDAKWKDYFHIALKLWADGEHEEAIAKMKEAAELEPEDISVIYRRLAEWSAVLNRHEDEAVYHKKIIEVNANDAIAHWALAKVLVLKLKRYEEGITEAKIAQKLYETSPYIQDELIAIAYEEQGNYELALKHYKIFLKGISYAPLSDDYKKTKKRMEELERRTELKVETN